MKKASVVLCMSLVVLFFLLLIALLIFAPSLISHYGTALYWTERNCNGILYAFYCSALPAAIALSCLFSLLYNIRSGRPFSKRTAVLIGIISWCCAAVTVITLIGFFFFAPLLLVSASMAFLFLIVRVVRVCFLSATELKEDSSLTI